MIPSAHKSYGNVHWQVIVLHKQMVIIMIMVCNAHYAAKYANASFEKANWTLLNKWNSV